MITDPSKLHVPMSKPAKTGNSILDAYNSQSKIPLYDESSAMSSNDISGVKGRDIPLSALRPNQPTGYSEDGRPVYSKSRLAEEADKRVDIASAYNKMNGIDDMDQDIDDGDIEYNPDADGDILAYLEEIIRNTEKNLSIIKKIYSDLAANEPAD